jgi:hypothetical protein
LDPRIKIIVTANAIDQMAKRAARLHDAELAFNAATEAV